MFDLWPNETTGRQHLRYRVTSLYDSLYQPEQFETIVIEIGTFSCVRILKSALTLDMFPTYLNNYMSYELTVIDLLFLIRITGLSLYVSLHC